MGNVPPSGPPPSQPPPGGNEPNWGEMKGKLVAAKGADRMILIAGLVFLIDSFLPWYGVGFGTIHVNVSGWNSGGSAVIAILLAIVAGVFAATRVLGMNMKMGSMNDGLVYLILGGGAFLFTLLRFVTQTSFTKFGLYIAIVAGAALAFGGWQKFNALKK